MHPVDSWVDEIHILLSQPEVSWLDIITQQDYVLCWVNTQRVRVSNPKKQECTIVLLDIKNFLVYMNIDVLA